MKTLKLLLITFTTLASFLITSSTIYAGCVDPAYCDSAPGTCSPGTCNGGETCKVNNGGWIYSECGQSCSCISNSSGVAISGSCSNDGAFCGGSGSDPYGGGGGGTCECNQVCTGVPNPTQICSEVNFAPCCSPGSPAPSGSPVAQYCGDTDCNNGETCSTCESDCGSCAATPTCGDSSCNGGENCSTCTADCGACPGGGGGGGGAVCGNGSCQVGESCSSCPGDCGSCLTCGDSSCNNGETCSTCAADCGACAGTCGDSMCTGFETCESCSADCGTCILLGNQPWWQVGNGLAFAGNTTSVVMQSNIVESTACIAPDCIAQLIFRDSTDAEESEGIPITGGGAISANGFVNTAGSQALSTIPSRFKENYTFFYRNSGLGLSPTSDFTGQESDIQEPITTKEAYYHQGDLTLQSPWTVSNGESYVIFVNGNLTISDPTNANQLIDIEEGGFLAFIVSGTITVTEDVGNETLTDTTTNLEGMFIADGIITIESRGEAGGGDDRFIGEGSFISWTRVAMDRDYSDGAGRETENQGSPTETFIFRPDLVRYTPAILSRPHSIWQESN